MWGQMMSSNNDVSHFHSNFLPFKLNKSFLLLAKCLDKGPGASFKK